MEIAGREVRAIGWLIKTPPNLIYEVMCTTHVSLCSGPETRRRHHGTAAEMPMLIQCPVLCVLVSVALAPT